MKKEHNLRKLNNKGFSLVELIIVIAIMAILVAIVVPNFIGYLDKARKARDLEMARVLGTALERVIATDPEANDAWHKIGPNSNDGGSHVEYNVTDWKTLKNYTITNVFEFTLTKKGEVLADQNHEEWHCELNYRNGVLRNARRKVTQPGQDLLWDRFTEEIATIEINIMYRKYCISQYKISKNVVTGRPEVWVCPVEPGKDGEGKGNGWVYYRLWPDADPDYMSSKPPVGTNANGGGKQPTTFY